MILTDQQFQYFNTFNKSGEDTALAELRTGIDKKWKDELSNLPAGADTDSYIKTLTDKDVKAFHAAYNEAVESMKHKRAKKEKTAEK